MMSPRACWSERRNALIVGWGPAIVNTWLPVLDNCRVRTAVWSTGEADGSSFQQDTYGGRRGVRGGLWRAHHGGGNSLERARNVRVSPGAHARRQTGFQRHLAGAERGELRSRAAHGAPGAGVATRTIRAPARRAGPGARRGWLRAARPRSRRRRRDSVQAGGTGQEEGKPGALAGAGSRNQVLFARRATGHLHAVPVSDLSESVGHLHGLRV